MRRVFIALLVLVSAIYAQDKFTAEQTIAELKDAFKGGDETVIEPVIQDAAAYDEPKVIREIARGLRHKSLAVRKASIRALGGMKSKESLNELHKLYRNDKKLHNNPKLFALLLKEIGRHGDKSSLNILLNNPFKHLTLESGRARIYGVANIRTEKSVEELVKVTRKGGGKKRGGGISSEWRGAFRTDMHAAIYILTGEDYGRGQQDLEDWWRTWRKKKLPRVLPVRPRVPAEISDRYEGFWAKAYYKDQKRKPKTTLQPPLIITENPTPDQVKVAVQRFQDAYKAKNVDLIAATIEQNGGVVSDKVVHELGRALRYKDRKVRMYSVIALGWSPDKHALRQLHRMYRREKKLGKTDEGLFAELLKAIGRHGARDSIKVLSDKPFKYHSLESSRARIYGLGNIRHKDAVEALIKGMRLTGTKGPRSARGFYTDTPRAMPEFNVALTVLTGVSLGPNQQAWNSWWNDNKRKLRVQPERPQVPQTVSRTWERYWNAPY